MFQNIYGKELLFLKITALVENRSNSDLKPMHGLSLYIQTEKHKILFDLGPDATLFENAEKRSIDLSEVDTVVISHGHMDHGGALEQFLKLNSKAKIYVQRQAFERHTSKLLFLKVNIGLDNKLKEHTQVVLVDGDIRIDEELSLFTVEHTGKCYSNANDALYQGRERDQFLHEQNLVIRDQTTALIMGCGHTGVVNILEKAEAYAPEFCVGGYHLLNPMRKKTVDSSLLEEISVNLAKYPHIQFYTCHCTGMAAYDYLAGKLPNMHYLSCGDTITITPSV